MKPETRLEKIYNEADFYKRYYIENEDFYLNATPKELLKCFLDDLKNIIKLTNIK